MNRKRTLWAIIFIVFLFGNAFTSVAQDTNVTTKWEAGITKRNIQGFLYSSYFGEDKNAYYVMAYNPKSMRYTLEKYNKENLQQETSKPLKDFGINVKKVFTIDNEGYVYSSYKSKKKQAGKSGFYRFNKSEMTFDYFAGPLDGVDFKDLESQYVSLDKSKILFVFEKSSKRREYNYELVVVDNQLKTLWKKSISTPTAISDFATDNEGNVYVVFANLRDNPKDRTSYNYVVMKLSVDNEKRFVVNMNNYFYHQCQLLLNKDNMLAVVGFYSDKSDEENTGGYYFSINNNFDAAENISYQKSRLFYNKNLKLHERYDLFVFKKPLHDENGNIVICSEINNIITYSAEVTGPSSDRYLYLDAFVFRITGGNKLAWMKRVPKYQLYDSFQTFLSGDNVVLIFWDDKRNLNNNENSENQFAAQPPISCHLVSVTLNKNGEQTKKSISIDTGNLYPSIKSNMPISSNCALLYARRALSWSAENKIGVICVE